MRDDKAINVADKGDYYLLSAPCTDEEKIVPKDDDAKLATALRELVAVAKPASKARTVVHEATVVEDPEAERTEEPEGVSDEGTTVGDVIDGIKSNPQALEGIASVFNFLSDISIKRKSKEG